MPLSPRLIEVDVPAEPGGAVLVLHGGAARRRSMRVSPAQLSVLRMIPIARRVVDAGGGRLAVYRVLNSSRGWDTGHTPVQDVAWALAEIASRLGAMPPACLLGHSLGGRAALLSAGRPEVASVAALAPWVQPDDAPAGNVAGTRILIVHGDRDRIADPGRSRAVARRLARQTTVSYVTVAGGTHAMLSRHEQFDGLAARFAAATLLGAPVDDRATGPDPVLAGVLAGEPALEL